MRLLSIHKQENKIPQAVMSARQVYKRFVSARLVGNYSISKNFKYMLKVINNAE
jgi:hypothetical protein